MAENTSYRLQPDLSDSTLIFLKKLRSAAALHIDLWESRKAKPNLSLAEFRTLLGQISDDVVIKWATRSSQKGGHAATGEAQVFMFEIDITAFGNTKKFFIKGYFFDKDQLRGVTIQSFREVSSAILFALEGKKS